MHPVLSSSTHYIWSHVSGKHLAGYRVGGLIRALTHTHTHTQYFKSLANIKKIADKFNKGK